LYDCPDSYNARDYDHDGLVNMTEFSLFAQMWQDYQPTSEVWQFCNLDYTGDSADIIDLADLMIFLDDWLWVACWRADEFPEPVQAAASPASVPVEPTVLEQAVELDGTICFLADLWQSDPNIQQETDPNDWQNMTNALCDELDGLLDLLDPNELMAYNLVAGDCCGGEMMMMSSGGGEGMFMETMSMESLSAEAVMVEPVADLLKLIDSLDEIIADNPDDAEVFEEIKAIFEDELENFLIPLEEQ
jgi:hypothetical protein